MTKNLQPKSEINLIWCFQFWAEILNQNWNLTEPVLNSHEVWANWIVFVLIWQNLVPVSIWRWSQPITQGLWSFPQSCPPAHYLVDPFFPPSANNISCLHAITILSFCVPFSFFCVQFSPKYFLDFSFLSWPHFLITPIQSPWNFLFCFLLSHFLVNTHFILFFRNVSSPFLF